MNAKNTTIPAATLSISSFAFVVVVVSVPFVGLTALLVVWYTLKYYVLRNRKVQALLKATGSEAHVHLASVNGPSWRDRLCTFIDTTFLGRVWTVSQALFGVIAFALYVTSLYIDENGVAIAELVLTGLFIVDYIINWFRARNKLLWVWSLQGVIDLVTILPSLVEVITISIVGASNNSQLQLLGLIRVLRALRILRILHVARQFDEFHAAILKWVLHTLCYLLVISGIVQTLMKNEYQDFTYATALYMMTATMSTCGYGDYVPTEPVTRGVLTLIIFITFPVTIYQLAVIVDIVEKRDGKKGEFSNAVRHLHVVIAGALSAEKVLPIFRELFQGKSVSICLLSLTSVESRLQDLLSHRYYQERCQLLAGTPLRQSDLLRCRVDEATLCILFNPDSGTSSSSDSNSLLYYFSVCHHFPQTRIALELSLAPTTLELVNLRDSALPVVDYMNGMVCKSVRAPGFSTLLSNLFRIDCVHSNQPNTWHEKYVDCASHELFSARIGGALDGTSNVQLSVDLYALFGAVIVARKSSHHFTLLPHRNELFRTGDTIFFVARRALCSDIVSYLAVATVSNGDHCSDKAVPLNPEDGGDEIQPHKEIEQALFCCNPGEWRECFRLEYAPRALSTVLVEEALPGHVDRHVCIFAGTTLGLFRMLLHFRLWKTKEARIPIVVVSHEVPCREQLVLLSWLPDVYFLKGSLSSHATMERVGLFGKADHLIVTSSNDESHDAEVICTFRELFENHQRCSLRTPVGVFRQGNNMHYLDLDLNQREMFGDAHDKSYPETLSERMRRWRTRIVESKNEAMEELDERGELKMGYHSSPFYAAGIAVPSSVAYSLMAQSATNPELSTIALLFTNSIHSHARSVHEGGEVFQWQVPRGMIGGSYGDLFSQSLQLPRIIVCLGLYRNKAWEKPEPLMDSKTLFSKEELPVPLIHRPMHRYVLTNPRKEERLFNDDLVFLLALDESDFERWSNLVSEDVVLLTR